MTDPTIDIGSIGGEEVAWLPDDIRATVDRMSDDQLREAYQKWNDLREWVKAGDVNEWRKRYARRSRAMQIIRGEAARRFLENT